MENTKCLSCENRKVNRWKNGNTWDLYLNLSSDSGYQEMVFNWIKENPEIETTEFMELLEEFCEAENPELILELGYKFSSFFSHNEWRSIDFYSILKHFKESLKEIEEYEAKEQVAQ